MGMSEIVKIPSAIYFPLADGNIIDYDVEEVRSRPIGLEKYSIQCIVKRFYVDISVPIGLQSITFYESDIGKIAFVTREDAEKAIGSIGDKNYRCRMCKNKEKGEKNYPCSMCVQNAKDHFERKENGNGNEQKRVSRTH